jgi:GNAT superfamily N-acetyltransferase
VQLIADQPENQPHRADVAKLLVHEKARRKGAAMALMEALEAEARARDISVLVLDTSTGSGPRRSTSVPAGKRLVRSRATP